MVQSLSVWDPVIQPLLRIGNVSMNFYGFWIIFFSVKQTPSLATPQALLPNVHGFAGLTQTLPTQQQAISGKLIMTHINDSSNNFRLSTVVAPSRWIFAPVHPAIDWDWKSSSSICSLSANHESSFILLFGSTRNTSYPIVPSKFSDPIDPKWPQIT